MLRRESVLVVDDDESFRDVIVEFLGAMGFEVMAAADGVEALDHIGTRIPDVVVADLRMPRMDGQELCAELERRLERPPAVILVSGDSRGSQGIGGVVRRFLGKPVDLDVLLAAVRELVARRDG